LSTGDDFINLGDGEVCWRDGGWRRDVSESLEEFDEDVMAFWRNLRLEMEKEEGAMDGLDSQLPF